MKNPLNDAMNALYSFANHVPELWGDEVKDGYIQLNVSADTIHEIEAAINKIEWAKKEEATQIKFHKGQAADGYRQFNAAIVMLKSLRVAAQTATGIIARGLAQNATPSDWAADAENVLRESLALTDQYLAIKK